MLLLLLTFFPRPHQLSHGKNLLGQNAERSGMATGCDPQMKGKGPLTVVSAEAGAVLQTTCLLPSSQEAT